MAKQQGGGLNFKTKVDISESKARLLELKKLIKDVGGISMAGGASAKAFDTKPLTEYQKEILKIKQDTLELAKQKSAAAAADRSASLATQEALKNERLLVIERNRQLAEAKLAQFEKNVALKEQIALEKQLAAEQAKVRKKPGEIVSVTGAGSQFNNSTVRSESVINGERVARAQLNTELAKQAILNNELALTGTVVNRTAVESVASTQKVVLSKKELAKLLAEEKYIQAQATKELKNNIREQINAKGSLEQRRAALIRLQTAFDRLSATERATPAGQRLDGIVGRLNDQVLTLERNTGRAGRNVGNYLSKAWSGLKLIANILPGVGLAGVLGFALEPILNYVKELDVFKKKTIETVKATAAASSEYGKALKDVGSLGTSISEFKSGIISRQELLNRYNETIGQTAGKLNSVVEVEKFYKDKSADFIQATFLRAQAQAALQLSAEKASEAIERSLSPSVGDIFLGTIKNIGSAFINGAASVNFLTKATDTAYKNQQDGVSKLNKQSKERLTLFDELQKKADKFAKDSGINFTKEDKTAQAQINAQQNLQKRVDAMLNEAKRKQFTREEEEVQAVKDKYAAIIKEVERFNANPKNQAKVGRVGDLKSEMNGQVSAIGYRFETDRLKEQLNIQKSLYEEYEEYKIKFGRSAADERYSNEINTFVNYLEVLKSKEDELTFKGEGDLSGPEKERLKDLRDRIRVETELEKKNRDDLYADAYRAARTHSQELQSIDADYQRKKVALGSGATEEQLSNLEREKDDRIRSANEANAFAKSGYAELMMQYDELTRGEIKRRLEAQKEYYRAQYKAGLLTAEQLAESIDQLNGDIDSLGSNSSFNNIAEKVKRYREQINTLGKDSAGAKEAQEEMYAAIAEGAADASSVISSLAASFQELGIGGEGLQDTLKNITGVVDGIGSIAEGLASGNPVDVVTGSIKLLTSAINLFNTKDKKLEKQIKGYQLQLDSLGKSYKQLERDVNNAVGNDIYTDQTAQIENLKKQQQELIKMRNAENDKKKTDAGKVKEFQDQIDSIPGQIDDINKAISQNLIQGTFRDLSNSLSDALSEAFKTGEDGIASMDDAFNGFIANAIKNSLKLSILEPVVKKFTDELTQYARDNNNSVVGFDFDKWREQLKDAGELFNAGLKGSEDFFKEIAEEPVVDPKKGISGNIVGEALTEGTANRVIGLNQGIYDLTKQNGMTMSDIYKMSVNNFQVATQIAANTLRTADNTTGIGEKLDKIVTNTTPKPTTSDPLGQALRDAGIPS